MHYKHTQVGYLVVILLLFIAGAIFTGISISGEPVEIGFSIFVIMIGMLALFSTLTVTVTREHLRLYFGVGLIRKKFAIKDILSYRKVRNKVWWGFGIRLTPHGWMYNISGLDAIELTLSNGKTVRVGTDQQKELMRALDRAKQL